MSTEANTDKRAALVAALRELADFYEAHPDAPLPRYPEFAHCVIADNDEDGQSEVVAVADALAVPVKFNAGSADAHRTFGAVEFKAFYVSRKRSEDYQEDLQFLAEHGRR